MKASELKDIIEKQIERFGDRDILILDEAEEYYKEIEDIYAKKAYVRMDGGKEDIFSIEVV